MTSGWVESRGSLERRGGVVQSATTWSVLPLLWLDLYLTKSAVTRTPGRARREEAIEAELERGGRRVAVGIAL